MQNTQYDCLVEFFGKIGPALFTATLVGGLLSGDFNWVHLGLMITGLGLSAYSHWHFYFRESE